MMEVLTLILDHVAMYLPLGSIFSLKLVCVCFNSLLSRDGFWKNRLELEFHITQKKDTISWLERYQLARRMGNILLINSIRSARFNVGIEISSYMIHPSFGGNGHRLLPYRAISAILLGKHLYYITDELELYEVNLNYPKDPLLLDTQVTSLNEVAGLVYVRNGDIYHYRRKSIQVTSRGDIIKISTYGLKLSYLTRNGVIREMMFQLGSNTWSQIDLLITSAVNMYQYEKLHIYLNHESQLRVYPYNQSVGEELSKFNPQQMFENVFISKEGLVFSLEGYQLKPEFQSKEKIVSAVCEYWYMIAISQSGKVWFRRQSQKEGMELNILAKSVWSFSEGLILIV